MQESPDNRADLLKVESEGAAMAPSLSQAAANRSAAFSARSTAGALERAIMQFVAKVRRDFPSEIAEDPRAFKRHVVGLIRAGLPPRPGRPRDPRTDAACEMVAQGKSVSEVLKAQIPDFEKLDTYTQMLAKKGLYQALGRRRRERKRPPDKSRRKRRRVSQR